MKDNGYFEQAKECEWHAKNYNPFEDVRQIRWGNKKYEMENYINHIAELDQNRIISEHKTIITILKNL